MRFASAVAFASLSGFSACAIAPKNPDEARAFAKDKFAAKEIRLPAKRYAGLADEIRAYAKRCIPETVEVDLHGRTMSSRVSRSIRFKWEVLADANHVELFVQKDIGALLNTPPGGTYYVVVQAERPADEAGKPSSGDFSLTFRWMDAYAFRGQDLAVSLESQLGKPDPKCPNLGDDSDLRDKL